MKMGSFDESIASYKKALQKDATFPGSQMGIAANLMFQEKHDEAIEWLQQYHDQARDDRERRQALYGMAVTYVDQGDLDKALEVIDTVAAAAEQDGEKAQLATDTANKAMLLCAAGKADEGEALYAKSNALIAESNLSDEIKENSKWRNHGNLALVALARNDLEMARSEAEEFAAGAKAARNPGQIRFAHELAGRIALAAEEYETAIQELSQANQQSPFALFQLAKANCGAGNEQKCKQLASEVANYNTLPTLRYALVRQEAADLAE
jgi:tetratricopeptide (TPR) repeat protein